MNIMERNEISENKGSNRIFIVEKYSVCLKKKNSLGGTAEDQWTWVRVLEIIPIKAWKKKDTQKRHTEATLPLGGCNSVCD